MAEIRNRKDMSRCHCGGLYRIGAQTPEEMAKHRHYAYCYACGTTRYLTDEEAGKARQAIKNAAGEGWRK